MQDTWIVRAVGRAVIGSALVWAMAGPDAEAYNGMYVPAYNDLAISLNNRAPYCPGVSRLGGKAPLDTVSQVDLERLRQYVRSMLATNFRLPPPLIGSPAALDDPFPAGLRYSGGTLVKPSLMDGIGDNEGRFTKIPAEDTVSGQAVYAESFTDGPVLWIHFKELQAAVSRMRYMLVLEGANAGWTANGQANRRTGYGNGLTPEAAVANCVVDYAANQPAIETASPGAVASIIAPSSAGQLWEAAVSRRYAYFRLSDLSTGMAHRAWFYVLGNGASPAPNFHPQFDDNGTGSVEGRWILWSMVEGGFAASLLSAAFGGDGALPVWCAVPPFTPAFREQGWRGYGSKAVAVMEWDFPDKATKQPSLEDPEDDGLSDVGCTCSSCPIETAAVWAGLQPQARVLIPLGVSDGLLTGGLRVKWYLTEYEINGCAQQMSSVGSHVIWTEGADGNDWQFVCVLRPSGAEVVFTTKGAAAGHPVDVARKYRLEKSGNLVKLRFPGGKREVVHEFLNNSLTAVSAKNGRQQLRVELDGGWPGMSAAAEYVGVWRLSQVNCSLLEAHMGYVDGLVRSVEYRYRNGGPTNTMVYYHGSKGFRNLDANGQVTWDTRVVTDVTNGALEIWSGITTNGALRVGRKQRRRKWYDEEAGLSMLEQTEGSEGGGSTGQPCTTLVAVATFPWGEEKVSETVAAGSAEAQTTHYTYYADPADSNNCSRLQLVEEPGGAWTRYEYDWLGRERVRQSGFKQAQAGDTNACRATGNVYAGDPALAPLNMPAGDLVAEDDGCPRLVVERLAGQEVGRTYYSYQPGRETIARAARRGAAYDDPGNLVTVTAFATDGTFKGRPLRVDRPVGQFSVFAYDYDTGRKELTATEDSGTGTGAVVTNGVRHVTVTDVAERTIRTTTTDIASGIELTGTSNTLDWLGRVVCASNRVDGTTTLTQYGCCGPDVVRDADGSSTAYTYDELKRVYASERSGVTTYNSYDVPGNVVETRRSAAGEADIVTSSQYDQAGRLTRTVDERGSATLRSYGTNALGEPTVTNVYPNEARMVETSYRDGQPKSVTGDAVRAVCHDYGVDERGAYTLVYDGDDTNATQWTRTYVDMLGRESLVLYPDGYRKETFYDAAGRPVRWSDGLGTTLTAYNGSGEAFRSATDMDGDDAMDLAGPDRISESETGCGMFQGKKVRWTEARVYGAAGGSLPAVIHRQWQSVDGTAAWEIAFGRTGRVEVVRQAEAAARQETAVHPNDTRTVSWFTNGLLKRVQQQSASGQVVSEQSYRHDAYGRLAMRTEAGPNGGTVWTSCQYDAGGNVTSQTVTAGGFVRATTYAYDAMGRRVRTVLPDGGVVSLEYEPTGELRSQAGARTYPVQYGYDARGRMVTMQTFRSGTNAAPDVTRWEYDARRGWQTAKVFADGRATHHEYRADGQLVKRTWARGVETTYGYDAAGSLANVVYSDGTPGMAMTLDRLGRATEVRDGTGVRTNVYAADGALTREILPGYSGELGYEFDATGRQTNLQLRGASGGTVCLVSYHYDEAGRLVSVGADDMTTRYAYGGDARTITGQVVSVGGEERFRGARQFDGLGRLERVGWARGADSLVGIEYGHNAADLRSRRTASDGAYWTYEYDELGQVVAGRRFTAAGEPETNVQYEYNYDLIGNRNWATDGGGRRSAYGVNEVNQYTEMGLPELVRQVVWVGTVFTFGRSASGGVGGGVPLRRVELRHDADGNLTNDGRFTYVWDGENRLVLASNAQSRIAFSYDYLSRRVGKQVFTNTADSWFLTSQSSFIYDGWNLVREVTDTPTPQYAVTNFYTWGLDLSGTLQGAGGIGGLLSKSAVFGLQSKVCFYVHDGNGNVTDLMDTNGAMVAHYEYDPFGNQTAMTGTESANNPFRFSTKYNDTETGLSYYGHRYYSPTQGRWISRDPLGEAGGNNLYGFVQNGPPNSIDALGLALYAFDGTANVPDDETNVYLTQATGWDGKNKWYERGIGNEEEYSALTAVLRQATGWGLSAKRSSMLKVMERFIETGDTDVDVIGFSRGAATAITFAEAVQKLKNEGVSPFCRIDHIRFLGLYDPVPGPFIRDRPGIPGIVAHTSIAYSLDEKRYQFGQSAYGGAGITALGFRGGHSDVGGGYQERGLANISLEWMIDQGLAAGAPFKYPKPSKSPKMVRHQEINYDLYLYANRNGMGGISPHSSVSRLLPGLVDQVARTPRYGVDVTPYMYYLDSVAPGNDEYRAGERRF